MEQVLDRKNVYLFELDSVRNTDAEIIAAQQALYEEIAVNGNNVVLTYNQLIDSRGFFSLFDDRAYYENIIELFEKGYIMISQYRDIKTLAQYLINSFEYEKQFIYSGWPLKSTQKRLLALIRRSLIYCDLSELRMYMDGKKTPEEIRDLFIEVTDEDKKLTAASTIPFDDQTRILKNLYWLLKVVFTLSIKEHIYVPPRDPAEYEDLRMHDILKLVLSFRSDGKYECWDDACQVITGLPAYQNRSQNRSVYLRDLKESYETEHVNKVIYQFAEAIINLCYNYACEISICNTSKHYNFGELEQGSSEGSFYTDFMERLAEYWGMGDLDNRFLLDESDTFVQFSGSGKLPDFARALRFAEYAGRDTATQTADADEKAIRNKYVPRYQTGLAEQIRRYAAKIRNSIGIRFILALIAVAAAIGVDLAISWAQSAYHMERLSLHRLLPAAMETILMLFITELVTYMISKRWSRFKSLSEALGDIRCLTVDLFRVLTGNKVSNEAANEPADDKSDHYSVGRLADFIPVEIKRYLDLRRQRPELFTQSDQITIADIDTPESRRSIIRNEELFNKKYGIVYKSPFNMMCVDPVKDKEDNDSDYYSYERVIPTAGRGSVIIARHNNKFVLLKQYRHALRRYQYAFPRGYGEPELTTDVNAVKELWEELKAKPLSEPVFIGSVSPDSGLTRTAADVYVIEIGNYSTDNGYEGIKDTVELSEDELEKMISSNHSEKESIFDDGFTLASYSLFRQHQLALS